MAVAGRVAISPKGDYDVSEVYKKLDLVRYNHNAYVAKKPSTGVEPTNEEYWMLMIENVSATDLTELKEKVEGILNGTLSVENSNNLGNQPPTYYATSQSVSDIVDGTTPAGDSLKLNGLTADEFVSNESLLVNTDFKNPVNSKGLTEYDYSSTQTSIDGWFLDKNLLMNVTNGGITLTQKGTVTGGFHQDLYNLEFLAGKTVTTSAKVNGSIYSYTVKIPDNIADEGSTLDTYGVHIVLNSVYIDLYKYSGWNDHMQFRFIISAAYTEVLTIEWAKLEIGSVATPFIPPNKELEKLKCGIVEADVTMLPQNLTAPILDKALELELGIYHFTLGGGNYTGSDLPSVNYRYGSATIYKRTSAHVVVILWGSAATGCTIPQINFYDADTSAWKGWKAFNDGGNADTVDNYHAHQLQLVGSDDVPMGAFLIARHNIDGDGRFKLMTNLGIEVSVANANTVGGFHANDLVLLADAKSSGLFSTRLGDTKINDTFTFQDLCNTAKVTFFTNWTDGTNFPRVYGSGVYIPCLDSADATLIYESANRFFVAHVERTANGDGTYTWTPTWDEKASKSNLANYLPLDGSVPMSGQRLSIYNGYARFSADTQNAVITSVSNLEENNIFRQISLANNTLRDINNCLQIYDWIDGNFYTYTVLHTGNSNATIKSTTAPSDTTAVWIDITNNKVKVYKDGAWTVMA